MSSLAYSVALLCVLVCSIAQILNPVLASEPCNFPAIFNFGDSNSDTGAESSAFASALPPNGESFFGMPNGRYSNGRLVIDFLAQSLGKPFLHSYLNSLAANFSYGANFAVSAATIVPPVYMVPNYFPPHGWSPFYLLIQFLQFLQFKQRTEIIYNQEPTFKYLVPKTEYFSEALYTIDIGQNDIGMGLFTNLSIKEVKATVPAMITGLTTHVKSLYSLGGRTFWIHNTGPIGCLPYVLTDLPVSAKQTDKAGCSIPHNKLCKYYNHKLKKAIYQLREELPLAAITLVDIYSAKYSIYKNAKKYGFNEPLQACCGYGGKYNYDDTLICFGVKTSMIVNGTVIPLESCKNPRDRISWDGIHYSEGADKIVFEKIVTGAFSDPPNTPPNMACHKFRSS